ncbi:hypothetical protein I4U23_003213 [Adineta vaga]|nr:hypothetical protein I4U23_003213 [Adineta vaga]
MNKDTQIKCEPLDSSSIKTTILLSKHSPLIYTCESCDIRFSNRNTLDAHRQHYCQKFEARKSQCTDLPNSDRRQLLKRKFSDISDSLSNKRLSLLSHDTYCQECAVLFDKKDNFLQHKLYHCSKPKLNNEQLTLNHPVQTDKFLYLPIPILSAPNNFSNQISKPLDLSKPKKTTDECKRSNSPMDLSLDKSKTKKKEQFYLCEFCSIHFRSLKTLQAHQENYCIGYRKQKKDENNQLIHSTNTIRSQSSTSQLNPSSRSTLFICRLCQYRGNTLRGMRMHFKFHLSNNQPCSDDDIIVKPTVKKCESLPLNSSESLLKCTICSAMFDYEEILLNHIRNVHTNERYLKCLECQSRFCSKWNLNRHMKFTHTNMKYDEQETLMNLINNSLNKCSCPFCQLTFQNNVILKQHIIHSCSVQSSATKEILNDIRKKIQNETFCSLCQISFQYKTSYDAHRLYYCRGSYQNNVKLQA